MMAALGPVRSTLELRHKRYCAGLPRRDHENCWEGKNCSYCEVPTYYTHQLQITPNPAGYQINHGMSATVYCKQVGHVVFGLRIGASVRAAFCFPFPIV